MKRLLTKLVFSLIAFLLVALPVLHFATRADAGYGPDRPRVYDWNTPADRVGATSPTFNSFINTPTYGDERNFARLAPVVTNQAPNDADYSKENVAANVGGQYWLRLFVHNDANQTLNDAAHNFAGVAHGVNVKFAIAAGQANGVDVMGYVDSSNGTPTEIWDSATLVNATQRFAVNYVPGSAEIINQAHLTGLALPDSIATTGAPIGFDQMNGDLPGCFQYSAYVFVKVEVVAPKLDLNKTVAPVNTENWKENLDVKPGDKITWKLDVVNKGALDATNVTVRDPIPSGLTLVPGSIMFVNNTYPKGLALPDTALGAGGVNVDTFTPDGEGVIFYRTTVDQPAIGSSCQVINQAFVRGDNISEIGDKAQVTINPSYCAKPNTPTYSCNLLTVTKTTGRTVKATVDTSTANGAKVDNFTFKFIGDTTETLNTDKASVDHTFTKDRDYEVTVTPHFSVNGIAVPDKPINDTCKAVVSFTTTPPPTKLVNTGSGNIFGIFFATSLFGAIAHKFYTAKRLTQ